MRAIGHKKILAALEQYNEWAHQHEIAVRKEYDDDRSKITPEIHTLFVDTLHQIQDYYSTHSFVENEALYQTILSFFHSFSVEQQVEAAKFIQNYLSESKKQY